MIAPLSQVLLLLAGSVFLVTLARRLGLPTTLAYLVLGLLLGPHALGVVSDSGTTRLLAELGVAFGLGALQVTATGAVCALIAHQLGVGWLPAIVLGGAVAMSSTAILLQQ